MKLLTRLPERWHPGLTAKFVIEHLLFATLVLVVIALMAQRQGRSALEEVTLSGLVGYAVEKQAALEFWLNRQLSTIENASRSRLLRREFGRFVRSEPGGEAFETAKRYIVDDLNVFVGERGEFLELFVMDPESGEVIASTDSESEGKFKEDRSFFVRGQSRAHLTSPYFSITEQKLTMVASAPLLDHQGALLAVIAGRIDFDELKAIVVRRAGRYSTLDSFVVDSAGYLITRPRFITDEAAFYFEIDTESVRGCRGQQHGSTIGESYRGVPALTVYRFLLDFDLCLVVKVDQAEAFAPSARFAGTMVQVGIVAMFGVAVLAFVFGRVMVQPILTLRRGVARIGAGDLGHRLAEQSRDELGELAREFNAMAAQLQARERDLKARREDLERSNEELKQFAYVASHDLQEPLRAVASYTELLMRRYGDKFDERAQKYIRHTTEGAHRMQELIEALLSYSRVTTQGVPLVAVDSNRPLESALANLETAIEKSGARVTRDRLPTLHADEAQLARVFQNLVGNALKFTAPGHEPVVHIGAERTDGEWRFSVRDNGIGMDPQYLDRIFVIFQRLHTRDEYSGSGIGLSIARRIIERHGGRIWVESAPNEGATFFFTIPDRTGGTEQ